MTEEEVRQNLIDRYTDLLRIKAEESGINRELELQLATIKLKLSSYNLDLESIEKMILEK